MEPLSVSHELKQPYSLDVQKLIEEAENEKLKKRPMVYIVFTGLCAPGGYQCLS